MNGRVTENPTCFIPSGGQKIKPSTRQATEERQEKEEIWGSGGFSIRHNEFEAPVGHLGTGVQRGTQRHRGLSKRIGAHQ